MAGGQWLAAEAHFVRQLNRLPGEEGTSPAHSLARSLRRRLALPLALCILSVSACATWQGRPHVLDSGLGLRDQVRLWVRGEGHQVHGVQLRGDSVTAVPFIRPPTCDTCALRLARTDIDSVQVRAFDLRRSIVAAIISAPVIYLVYLGSQIPRD